MDKDKLPVVLILIIIALLLFNAPKAKFPQTKYPFYTLVGLSTINAFGFNFEDFGHLYPSSISGDKSLNSCSDGSQSEVHKEGESLVITGSGAVAGNRKVRTEVTGADEVLILYSGSANAYCSNGYPNAGASIAASVEGSGGGSVGISKSAGTTKCPSGDESVSSSFEPSYWKFKNNFDGTWSSIQSLSGLQDAVLVLGTYPLYGDKQYLNLIIDVGSGCNTRGGSSARLQVFNVVKKVNGFALCKADQYINGYDASGNAICQNFTTLKLQFEEALHEALSDYIQRKETDLAAKELYLNQTLNNIQQQILIASQSQQFLLQQQINNLTLQLTETRRILQLVQNKDSQVIQVFRDKELLPSATQTTQQVKSQPYSITKIITFIVIGAIIFKLFFP